MSTAEEQDLRAQLGSTLDGFTPGPVPLQAFIRQGQRIRIRRRLSAAASIAVIAALAASAPPAERLGDLSLRQVQPVAEHDHRALPFRQCQQRRDQRGALGLPGGLVGNPRIGQLAGELLGHASFPESAPVRVENDLPQVGGGIGRPAQPRPGCVRVGQSGLRQVLGQAPVTGQAVAQARQLRPLAVREVAELLRGD
jgi:hypothetical protein